nr:MAG TPA: hypothetical protein [Caudoviricetes sp.]
MLFQKNLLTIHRRCGNIRPVDETSTAEEKVR